MSRKVFDDEAGVHVVKPGTIAPAEIFEPLVDVFAERCLLCDAEPGKPCITLVGTRKDRVYPHSVRVDSARSKRQ